MDAGVQLDGFIGRYSPEVANDARRALAFLTSRFPTATQIAYDNYNAVAVGFGPSDRASEAIFSIALYPRYVTLFFLRGVALPDPKKLLEGSGSRVRHIKLRSIERLEEADVVALIDAAVAAAKVPLPRSGQGPLIIKSVSAKQRPRRG
jgi:hypothetical protein